MAYKKCRFENSDCPLFWENPPPDFDNDTGCYEDIHHHYWQSTYNTDIEQIFGNLPENKKEICRAEHNEIHATEQPPELPSREYMLGRIILALTENRVFLNKKKRRKIFGD